MALILQVVVNVFVTDKESKYSLKTKTNKYEITEKLKVVDDTSFYDFTVIDDNDSFYTFSFSDDFNKQTEVIKDIKYFKSGDISCIFPIYKREKYGNVSCLYNGEQVSYSYLKQIGNKDIESITTKLKKENYKSDIWDRVLPKTVNLSEDGKGINVYQENILDDYTFLIWRYKGLYILREDKSVIKDYLESDQYDNSLSALVGKYYVSAVVTDSNRINELFYYNTKEFGKGIIPLPDTTSSEFYFNGVYDNKLYMTDVGNAKQYSIDPAFEKVEVVGDKDSDFVVVESNKLKKMTASEFLSQNVYFDSFISNQKISKKYGEGIEIIKERSFYYFKTKDGSIYRAHEDNINKAVLLFKFDDLTEWKVKNGDILITAGDKVYFYDDLEGLLLIAVNNELKYNHKNICDFWKK